MRALPAPVLAAAAAFAFAGCGEETPTAPAPPQETQSGASAGGGEACANVPVPGHEAVELRSQGVPCSDAEEVAAAALGKGRQAYEAGGFACEPSEAGGGDTNYVCTRGDARVSFRYGAA